MAGLIGRTAKRYDIVFKGEPFILVGSKTQGALYKQEQLDNIQVGTYYLYGNGKIRRSGKIVGSIKDIEFV